ncbi:MAG: hypothetical protein ACKVQU_25175 [Burkholderiales bacterium]
MKFLFDNNLSPHLARGIAGLSGIDGARIESVVHLREKFPANAKDIEWIGLLSHEEGWVVISCDHFSKSDEEREVLRQAGLIIFVLDSQWTHHRYWDQAHNLVRWWPAIVDQADSMTGGAAFRVHWRFTNTKRFEQIRL